MLGPPYIKPIWRYIDVRTCFEHTKGQISTVRNIALIVLLLPLVLFQFCIDMGCLQYLTLARFSLQQCREVYTHMDIDLKKMLRSKIESIAPHYGLLDICYSSFHKSHGFKCQISASDAVY